MTDSVARIFSLAALEAGQTDKQITVAQTVGGIEAGTVYPEGTSLATIISDLLSGSSPSTMVTIYYGATDNVPSSVSGLISTQVAASVLTAEEGYIRHIDSGDISTKQGQYPVVAIPNTYIIKKWCVQGFDYNMPHTLVTEGDYNIYYLDDVSYDVDLGGIDYIIKIEEVQ